LRDLIVQGLPPILKLLQFRLRLVHDGRIGALQAHFKVRDTGIQAPQLGLLSHAAGGSCSIPYSPCSKQIITALRCNRPRAVFARRHARTQRGCCSIEINGM
jgi:hypothetical protein